MKVNKISTAFLFGNITDQDFKPGKKLGNQRGVLYLPEEITLSEKTMNYITKPLVFTLGQRAEAGETWVDVSDIYRRGKSIEEAKNHPNYKFKSLGYYRYSRFVFKFGVASSNSGLKKFLTGRAPIEAIDNSYKGTSFDKSEGTGVKFKYADTILLTFVLMGVLGNEEKKQALLDSGDLPIAFLENQNKNDPFTGEKYKAVVFNHKSVWFYLLGLYIARDLLRQGKLNVETIDSIIKANCDGDITRFYDVLETKSEAKVEEKEISNSGE